MSDVPAPPERAFRNRFWTTSEFGLALAIVAAYVAVLALDPQRGFASPDGLRLLLRETVMLGIFAIGAAIVIIAGGIDLSIGSVIAFTGVVCATILRALVEKVEPGQLGMFFVLVAVIALTLLVGLAIGTLHALLITRLGLPPFVATLSTLVGLRSAARVLAGGAKVPANFPEFRYLFTNSWIPVSVFVVVAVGMGIVMRRTVLGRHLYALGGNEAAARLSGLRTDRLKWIAYSASALLATVAGILYAARQGQGDADTIGVAYELNAIAAAVVGGCSLRGGVGTVTGTVLGATFLTLVVNGISMVIKKDATLWEGVVVGSVVVLAVAVNTWRRRS